MKALVPGQVGLVSFEGDEDWTHERLFCYPVGERTWMVLSADGDFYEEDWDSYTTFTLMTGRSGYPSNVEQVVAFGEPLDKETIMNYIVRGRVAAKRLRSRRGHEPTRRSPTRGVDYWGAPFDLPAAGLAERLGQGGGAQTDPPRRERTKDEPVVEKVGSKRVGFEKTGDDDEEEEAAPEEEKDEAAGETWYTLVAIGDLSAGSEMIMEGKYVRLGDKALIETGDGTIAVVVKTNPADDGAITPTFHTRRELPPGPAATLKERLLGVNLPGSPKKGDKVEETAEDARTLAVDYDDQGIRFKDWRRAVNESYEDFYGDAPIGGPASCLTVCRHMLHHGGDPKLWLSEWSRDLGVTKRDRLWHEMGVLVEVLWLAATYDQVNLGNSMSLEAVVRRLSQIVDATAEGVEGANWESVRHYSGVRRAVDIVPPELRSYAHKLQKEDTDTAASRRRPYGGGQAEEAVAAGGLPAGRRKGKGDGRGKGAKGTPTAAPE